MGSTSPQECGILDSLDDLGYDGPLLDENLFLASVEAGPSSPDFTGLVAWISSQLCSLCDLEASVSPTTCAEDADSFELELSGLLKELYCPYKVLTQGEMINRLGNKPNRLLLLDFLTTELQSAKMVQVKHPSKPAKAAPAEDAHWKPSSRCLKNICILLKLSKPPPNVTDIQLFTRLESQLKSFIANSKHDVGKPLFKWNLTSGQWAMLATINEQMRREYSIRRQMLLKRLDVTVQSFGWSDRAKSKEDEFSKVYRTRRNELTSENTVTIASMMAAREDLAKLKKTSSGAVRKNTQCAINKVMMGHVPDRGGRPQEATPPPPEMPSFKQRRDGGGQRGGRGGGRGGGGGGGGGRGGGGGGGRVQGGWSGGGGGGGGGGGNWNQGGGGGTNWNQQGGGGGGYYNNQGGGGYGGQQGGYGGGYGGGGQGGYGGGGQGGYGGGGQGGYGGGGQGGYGGGGQGGYGGGGQGGYGGGGGGRGGHDGRHSGGGGRGKGRGGRRGGGGRY